MRKSMRLPMDYKSLDDASGEFEAYLSVFGNVDHGNDMVKPGAFAKSINEQGSKPFPLLDQHDSRHVIGGFTASEDAHGLKIRGEFNLDTQRGKEAYSNAKKGYLTGFSMGYSTEKYSIDGDVRVLEEVKLYEGSIVTFPMNEAAQLTAIKAQDIKTEREFERFLRDAGFSRDDAKTIVADGYKGLMKRRDAGDDGNKKTDEDLGAIAQALTEALTRIKNV